MNQMATDNFWRKEEGDGGGDFFVPSVFIALHHAKCVLQIEPSGI